MHVFFENEVLLPIRTGVACFVIGAKGTDREDVTAGNGHDVENGRFLIVSGKLVLPGITAVFGA